MSVEPKFTDAKPVDMRQFPVVLRFKGLWPQNLARFKFHDERRGGDLEHIDEGLTKYNEVLVGEPDWDRLIREEIAEMRLHNFEEHVRALEKKSRQSQARKVEEAGPVDPWRICAEGPLREGILTVSKDWFGGSGREQWDPGRVTEFKRTALKFLLENFPSGQLRYASVHLDEEALHIHFVIATWTEKLSMNRGCQFLLQPSVNPLIANYEHAQNVAGAAFAEIGIARGQRHAEARRKAREEDKPLPKKRRHTPPSKWREEERRKAEEEKARILAETEEQRKEIVEGSRALSTAAVKKSRKHMIKDAKARKRRALAEEAKMIRCRDAARAEGQKLKEAADAASSRKKEAEAAVAAMQLVAQSCEATADEAEKKILDAKAKRAREEEELARIVRDKQHSEQSVAGLRAEETGLQAQIQTLARRRGEEEAALTRAQIAREAQDAALENAEKDVLLKVREADVIADAIETGLKLVAEEVLVWREQSEKKPQGLRWTKKAPQEADLRDALLEKISPALPMVMRLAKLVAQTVSRVLKRERKKLKADADYVRTLREQWEPDVEARLNGIARGPDNVAR